MLEGPEKPKMFLFLSSAASISMFWKRGIIRVSFILPKILSSLTQVLPKFLTNEVNDNFYISKFQHKICFWCINCTPVQY